MRGLFMSGMFLMAGFGAAQEKTSVLSGPDFRKTVRAATAKVFPAVVYVRCIIEDHSQGKKKSQQVSGSGVIISPDGTLLTNWHVVDKATHVRCLLYDGRAYDAKVIGSDKDTDLALLKLVMPENSKKLAYATLGDSESLREGDFVMAMGAPWGLSRSVTIGIISCRRRFLEDHSGYSLWLQTDASISPGNSGGPLVNTAGEIVGINTLGINAGGDMGFSIPSDTIKLIVPLIRKYGRVEWSWTGLQLQPLRDFNKNIYFAAEAGVMVAGTDPESPARRAGILPRDRIVAINYVPVTAVTDEGLPAVRRILGTLSLKQEATLELVRDGRKLLVKLKPRKKGKVEGEELDCPRWDFTAKTINQFDNPNLFFLRKKGVFVYGTKQPGNAANAGLRSQDILLKIGKMPVSTLEDVKKLRKQALANIDTKSRILLTVLRNGVMRLVVLDFSRDYDKE